MLQIMLWTRLRAVKPQNVVFTITRSLNSNIQDTHVQIQEKLYTRDQMTNVTPKILSHINRNLHRQPHHPLCLIKQKIVNYMYDKYKHHRGNQHRGMPLFSVHEDLSPVVTLEQNFDSLLVAKDHVSRKKSDSYYVDSGHMLRAHTSAHQSDLIKMGLDNFLVVGDVYRRDEIDATHYPVFHQMEGVRLISNTDNGLTLFEAGDRDNVKQGVHSLDAARLVEADLKECLLGLAKHLFGDNVQYRWVDCYFPFTHPSWELEVFYNNDWLEVLGCGVMEQEILFKAGVHDKVGWAFGLGLERLAMVLYSIPDIRLFWSNDSGFLSQFESATPDSNIVYKTLSKFPQCTNDVSFWLPQHDDDSLEEFSENDFYDLVRDVGGDMVEQVKLVDNFKHPKTGKTSHCYRIVYRHMSKTLTQAEANEIHQEIERVAVEKLNVTIR